jgi:hypothetical protein
LSNGSNIISNKLPIRYPKIINSNNNASTSSSNSIVNNLTNLAVDNLDQDQNKNGVIINEIVENDNTNNQISNTISFSNGLDYNNKVTF